MSGYGGKNCGRLIIRDQTREYANQVLNQAYKRSKTTYCHEVGENIIGFRDGKAIIIMPDRKYKKIVWLPQDYCLAINESVSMRIQRKFNISVKMYEVGTCIPYQYFVGRNGGKVVIAIKGRFNILKVKLLTI